MKPFAALRPLFLALLAGALSTALSAQPSAPRTELTADDLLMTSTDTETRAICTGNVVLTGTNLKISCDRLEIIAVRTGDATATVGTLSGFKYLLATGNVRIVQGDREATCGRAEVLPDQERVILYEDPVVLDRSSDLVARGSQITLHKGQRRLEVLNPKLSGPPVQDLGAEADSATE